MQCDLFGKYLEDKRRNSGSIYQYGPVNHSRSFFLANKENSVCSGINESVNMSVNQSISYNINQSFLGHNRSVSKGNSLEQVVQRGYAKLLPTKVVPFQLSNSHSRNKIAPIPLAP